MKRSFVARSVVLLCCLIKCIITQEIQIERRYACWGSVGPPVVSAQCPRDMVLHVVRAGLKVQNMGGSRCEFNEADCGCTSDELGCQLPDVEDLCMGKTSCRLDVTQQYIDTGMCQGFSDYMFIEYRCIKVDENSQDVCITGSSQQMSGFLKSPNYPHTYPHNRHCECTLSTTVGATIDLSILDLQLADRDCTHDGIELEYSGQLLKLCGDSNGLKDKITTNSNSVKLVFDTDQDDGDNGFWIKYNANPQGEIAVECVSTYKPEKFIQMVDPPKLPQQENDFKEIYTAEAAVVDNVEKEVTFFDDSSSSHDISNTATADGLIRSVILKDSPNLLHENKEIFENIIFDETHKTPGDRSVIKEQSIKGEITADENIFIRDGESSDISVKLDEKIRQALRDGDVQNSILGNAIQYTDQVNGIDIIEVEPVLVHDTEVMKGITSQKNVSENKYDIHDSETLNEKTNVNHSMETDENQRKQYIQEVRSKADNSEQQHLNNHGHQLIDRQDMPSDKVALQQQDEVLKTDGQQPSTKAETGIKEHGSENNERRQLLKENKEHKPHVSTHTAIIEDNAMSREDKNTMTPRRSYSYDRISFERDLFEEYTNLPNSGRERQSLRQNSVPRNSRLRPTPKHTARPQKPKQAILQDNFKNRPVRPNLRVRPVHRKETPTLNDQQQTHANYRDNSSPIQNKVKPSNRIPKERLYTPKENKPPTHAPWWWQYTAKMNKINKKPTKAPTPVSIIMNNAINHKMKKHNYQDKFLGKGNLPSQQDMTNDKVPLDSNADNFNANNGDSIQTGLLEAEREEDEPAFKKSSMTVTAIAVGVISLIVLVVVVGIVVKWILNKREQKRAMRHRHQKECVMRQQHLRQSSGMPRNLR